MNRRGKAALGAAVLLAAVGGLYWSRSGGEGDPKRIQPEAQVAEEARPEKARPARGAKAALAQGREAPLPREPEGDALSERARSLRGTDVDGALRVGPDGALIIGPDVVAFFEYFLSATGEESDDVIRARIEAAIREKLDGAAEAEALALLDKYMAYREAGRDLKALPEAEDDPAARLDAVKKLRRAHFGEEAASAMFGDEELEGEVAAERSRVLKDSSLSPEEREAKLAELEAKLPEGARRAREEARRPLRLREDEAAMRAEGASEEDIHRHRADAVGEEAADRLRELDEKRAAWKRRIEAAREARDRIVKQYGDDEAGRAAAEAKLLEESFAPDERARAKAILGIGR